MFTDLEAANNQRHHPPNENTLSIRKQEPEINKIRVSVKLENYSLLGDLWYYVTKFT